MNVNKVIHEAMGLCWHVVSKDKKVFDDIYGRFNIRYCVKCDQSWNNCIDGSDPEYERGPDYTDPVHYCALMDWMRDTKRAFQFGAFVSKRSGTLPQMVNWIILCRQEQITLIAEAIEAGALK